MQNQLQPEEQNPSLSDAEEMADSNEDAPDAERLQYVLQQAAELKVRRRRDTIRIGTLVLAAVPLHIAFWLIFVMRHLSFVFVLFYGVFFFLFSAWTACNTNSFRFAMREANFNIEELIRIGGVRAVGPLLEMRYWPIASQQKRRIDEALIALLPQLKFSDAPLIQNVHRCLMYMELQRSQEVSVGARRLDDLCVAMLNALEQVGDERAIPIVERLAGKRAFTRRQKYIKQAAIDCLPALRENCGGVQSQQTLLRGSAPPAASPENLLRPASAAFDTAPHELLRAAGSEQETPPA